LDKAAAAKVQLQVQPNRVELAGDTLTMFTRNTDGWLASYQIEVTVVRGTLDSLSLRVPISWSSSPTLDSTPPASVAASQDDYGRIFSIHFAEAVPAGSAVKLKIDSPVSFDRPEVAVPNVLTTPPIRGDRYFCVPSRLEKQPVVWSAIGMKPAELPASFRAESEAVPAVRTFEATSDEFHLALQPRLNTPQTARVRLADTKVSLDSRGAQLITTRFVIEPQGQSNCVIRVPGSQQLITIHLAERPALTHIVSHNEWRVTLGPPQLPSILEVTTRASNGASENGRLEIHRPVLLAGRERIPVEINLWSVGCPTSMPRPAIGVTDEATIGEQAVLRFDQLLSVAESAAPAAIQQPAPDGYNWYQPWSAMLTSLRTEAINSLAVRDSRIAPSQISQPVEEQLTAASARLEAWSEQCTAKLAGSEPEEAAPEQTDSEPANVSIPATERWVYCVTDGALDRLTLNDESKTVGWRDSSMFGLLAIAGISLAIFILARRTKAPDLLYHWPHAFGFLIGIACWAWLQPSWAGLLVAAACVALALHSGWPGRAIRLDASTVLRATNPK
jgi:hypothetical protein